MYYDYEYGEYSAGGIYIAALEDGELYDDVSVCLKEYGIELANNQIAIPVKREFYKYKSDLASKEVRTVEYGPFRSLAIIVELKANWREICKPLDY